jgi:tetratricopeptide (TPR) repeat protein
MVAPLALAAAVLALAGGCSKPHGDYTGKFKQDAEGRMNRLKAGTDWDMAHQQFLSGDLDKALRNVEMSISRADDVAKSHLLKGRILLEMGRMEDAVACFDRSLELDPTLTESHYYKGVVYERFGSREEALASYQAASAQDPSNPQFVVAAAEMLMDMDRLEEARELLTSGSSDFEHNAGVRQTLGHIAMIEGKVDDAVRLFNEACLLAPDEPSLLEDLARAQIAARRFSEAEYSLRRLLAKDTDNTRRDLRHLQARCLIEIDRPVEARSILTDIVNDPQGANDVQTWSELGNIAVMLKDERRLRECATRLVAIAPDRQEGYFLMASWQRSKGNIKGAIASLDKAVERAHGDATPAIMRGVLYMELGMKPQAAQSFRVAMQTNPSDTRAQALLAQLESGVTVSGAKVAE